MMTKEVIGDCFPGFRDFVINDSENCLPGYIIRLPCSVCVCVCAKLLQSCLTLCNPVDCTPQAPLSMRFSRQEYWSGLLGPPPGDLPNPGIEPASPMSPALTGRFFTTGATWEAPIGSSFCPK